MLRGRRGAEGRRAVHHGGGRVARDAGGRSAWSAPGFACAVVVSGLVVVGAVRGQEPDPDAGPAPILIWVDSALGHDGAENDGTIHRPLRTIARALALASDEVAARGDSPLVELRIRSGIYGPGAADGEVFPVELPAALRDLALVAAEERGEESPPAGGPPERSHDAPILESVSPQVPALSIGGLGPGEGRSLQLRGLRLRGGLSGMACVLPGTSTFDLAVEDCAFEGQSTGGLEVYLGSGARATVTVRSSRFAASSGGIVFESADSSLGSLVVEGCVIEDLHGYGPAGLLGAGVDVHLDPLSTVSARIERNSFRGMPSAVRVTSSEVHPLLSRSGGQLDVKVIGNLIHGRDSRGSACMKHALYLSLWPHHATNLLAVSNTVVDIDGNVVFSDNLSALREQFQDPVSAAGSMVFVNNVCQKVGGASEFAEESDAAVRGIAFPLPGTLIACNLLEKSSLGVDGREGNITGDAVFIAPEAGDFRLAPDSPGIDRGAAAHALWTDVDLLGNCRRAAGSCRLDVSEYPIDLGVYEQPGYCDREPWAFTRGDCDRAGGAPDLTDAIFLFGYLFLGGRAPSCEDACDSNDDGTLDIADGIYTLSYLFTGGKSPSMPFANPGTDPSRDCLNSCR